MFSTLSHLNRESKYGALHRHLTYLPNNLKSTDRLFADDTIIYMTVSNGTDATAIQQDLDKLAKWEDTWQMEFHPQKCSVLHITRSRNPNTNNTLFVAIYS